MNSPYWESRQSITPDTALALLQEGNERFINNLRINRNLMELVEETAEEQIPFATILSCSDSRISTSLIFDQGLGDIISIRQAGNIASTNAIGSMEYACSILGSKLIVVMGHTNCTAVKIACDDISIGNLGEMIGHLQCSLHREIETPHHQRTSNNGEFINRVSELNVLHNIETILNKSPIIREMLEKEEVYLVGAMYSVETGKVTFLDSTAQTTLESMSASEPFDYELQA